MKPTTPPAGPVAKLNRRQFTLQSAATATMALAADESRPDALGENSIEEGRRFVFSGADSAYHGDQWQTLNPGYWKIQNGQLRRRMKNVGDRARDTGFPFHAESHQWTYQRSYDPSLPSGILYQPHWDLAKRYTVEAIFVRHPTDPRPSEDDAQWRMHQPGYGVMGIAIGGQNLYESFGLVKNTTQIVWCDDHQIRVIPPPAHPRSRQGGEQDDGDRIQTGGTFTLGEVPLAVGQELTLSVSVVPLSTKRSDVQVTCRTDSFTNTFTFKLDTDRCQGFAGIAARGRLDFGVNEYRVEPFTNQVRDVPVNECLTCYALGDTLRKVGDHYHCRFIAIFASPGERAELRISPGSVEPSDWLVVPIAGAATIVDDDTSRYTAVIDAVLPADPSATTHTYTIFKDGADVTADRRVGTDACGPGTGLVGDVPGDGQYVGRLPQLRSPYRLCGLSCHAINSGLQVHRRDGYAMTGGKDRWQVRDQPTVHAYQHLDEYEFQILVWEDDVWYMELLMYPPSTDDAYKIVTLSIAGPTSRWQMMRHWNVINPGDHDYGMDDIKGPEQLILRRRDDLGQDSDYLKRNFQIVHHLTTGETLPDPTINPKKWRAWRMPGGDFTLLVLDSRLWRSSQDVDLWDDSGWGQKNGLYERTDPTRALLGEEQFAWLKNRVTTDASPIIACTGLSGLHTIWTGGKHSSGHHPQKFDPRDRVVADYAGWVKAGADRVIELLSSRTGVVTVYGDVHNGCILRNLDHRLVECSFGPIGRSKGRGCIPGFGSHMTDIDGRRLSITALYHEDYDTPDLHRRSNREPYYWNFLEMNFDVDRSELSMTIRNLIDPPSAAARGGRSLTLPTEQTGRPPSSHLEALTTVPNADVRATSMAGHPIRGFRSDSDGRIEAQGLTDVSPGESIILTASDGAKVAAHIVTTVAMP